MTYSVETASDETSNESTLDITVTITNVTNHRGRGADLVITGESAVHNYAENGSYSEVEASVVATYNVDASDPEPRTTASPGRSKERIRTTSASAMVN